LITDLLRNKLAAYIVELIDGTNQGSADLGLGGNSTSPAATALDVPLNITPSQYVATRSDDNVVEIKLSVEGSNITGKVIREASFGADDSGDSFDDAAAFMLSRVAFEGVGPFAANEQIEIFLVLEVE
jgi:hypothetical protein